MYDQTEQSIFNIGSVVLGDVALNAFIVPIHPPAHRWYGAVSWKVREKGAQQSLWVLVLNF
jgi:hypothetical protein